MGAFFLFIVKSPSTNSVCSFLLRSTVITSQKLLEVGFLGPREWFDLLCLCKAHSWHEEESDFAKGTWAIKGIYEVPSNKKMLIRGIGTQEEIMQGQRTAYFGG